MGPIWTHNEGMKRIELTLRLPVDLHEELVAEANRLGISLNALILVRLQAKEEP
jgi:predicted HicB family RNase H-like nuclease